MPIPKPIENESKDDFISRCMSDDTIQAEYPDNEQRTAVCMSQWKDDGKNGERGGDRSGDKDRPLNKNKKLETVEAKGIEILETGRWNGYDVTETDLDLMIKNFKDNLIEPYLNIDHSKKATEQFKEALGAMSLGFVDKLYKKGKKLIADFKQIPKTIAELIKSGALKKKSVEYYPTYKHANGNTYQSVLQAVTFHGANGVPAVNTLSDFIALYKNELQTLKKHDKKDTVKLETQEDKKMDTVEIKQNEYEELLNFKSSADELNKSVETLKAEKDEAIKSLKAKEDELNTLKKDVEKKEAEMIHTEAENYVDTNIKEGKILPKFKDMYIRSYKRSKDEGEEALTLYKEEIEAREANMFKSVLTNADTNTYNASQLLKDTDALEEAIQLKMKKTGKTWEEARKDIIGEEV
jgi:hypothetical protein